MRYEDFKNEIAHARNQVDRLERAATREWVTYGTDGQPSLMIRVYVSGFEGHARDGAGMVPLMSISASRWRPQDGAETTLINGNVHKGGYFDHVHHFDGLTAKQLFDVGLAREIVERWVAGESPRLPELFIRDEIRR